MKEDHIVRLLPSVNINQRFRLSLNYSGYLLRIVKRCSCS